VLVRLIWLLVGETRAAAVTSATTVERRLD